MTQTLPAGMAIEEHDTDFTLLVASAKYPEFSQGDYKKLLVTLPTELTIRLIGFRLVGKL